MDEALKTFIIEGRELLQTMEDALLKLEQSPEDDAGINEIFRAAHTIKGSSGLFGLNFVVDFTHVAESVLDKVRSGEIVAEETLIALLLEVCDHIGRLLTHVDEGSQPGEATNSISQKLCLRLNGYLSPDIAVTNEAQDIVSSNQTKIVEVETRYETEGGGEVQTDNWHLSLRFALDVIQNGMDPLSFVRYLCTFGEIVHLSTITDGMPDPKDFNPEFCYLGFEISFKTNAEKSTIEGVFDFVREGSQIRIVPPRSKMDEYIELIKDLPETEMMLGQILVKCGTLTEHELEQVLSKQSKNSNAREHRPIGEELVDAGIVQPLVVVAALEKQKQVKEAKSTEASLIRVDAKKLDDLINLVGELIIAGAGANLVAKRVDSSEMTEATSTVSRLVEEVRDSALALRMVQIGATFGRFQRVVRDVSKELGKDIRLVVSGEETELDKTVVERIGDPLTHLVRNSMDHGIESAEVRLARGKPAYGTLKLNAYHDAGNIIIKVSDDGGGLNRDKILAKALERELVKPDQVLTDQEIYNLIFEAGFSTADSVSNLSGRGVGMDVVRRNIQALRGTVDIQSTPGHGTTMFIRLPLTLAIIDGFLVEVGGSAYVIPLELVIECIELSPLDHLASQEGGRDFINLRGEVLPYIKLREQFEIEGDVPRRQNIVVVKYGDQKIGIVVDSLLGEFQTVIKPLGKVFDRVKGIGGFTILGTGEVALILDIPRMVQKQLKNQTSAVESTS